MFDFLFGKKEEISLLIDIGNGSVGGAFVLFGEGKLPKVLYNVRMPFVVSEKTDSSKLLSGMETLLNEVLKELMKKSFQQENWKGESRKIHRTLVSFSSPWFLSKTKNIHITEDKSFIISQKFLESILEKENLVFQEELVKNSDAGESFRMIEKSIVHTKINGYTLDESLGKKTKTFDLSLCLAVIPEKVGTKVEEIILKHTHAPKDKVSMHTFPLISFTVLRDIFSDTSNFLIMDITSEITEVSLVTDSMISKTVSFPSGKNFIIRQIAKAFAVPHEIAESTLHLHNSGRTDTDTEEKMMEVLADVEKEWSIYLEDSLSQLSKEMILPKRVYVTTDDDVSNIFIEFLKMSKTDTTSAFRKNVDTVYLDKDTLGHHYEKNISSVEDDFIGILSIFYNKIRKNSAK